jgi:hypothetical protein
MEFLGFYGAGGASSRVYSANPMAMSEVNLGLGRQTAELETAGVRPGQALVFFGPAFLGGS